MSRPLTGRHVFGLFAAGFGIIIAVNLVMARNAIHTFPGLVVGNSYVASQSFDARRAAQQDLGWSFEATYENGRLRLALSDDDGPVAVPAQVDIGRPTEALDDHEFAFTGAAEQPIDLAPGLWRLNVSATSAEGVAYERHVTLRVSR